VREQRVDTSDGLLGIQSVNFIFRLAILFWNSEDAQRFHGFEWIGRFRMEHVNANVKIVTAVEKPQCDY